MTLSLLSQRTRQLPDQAILQRVADGEIDLFEILMRRHNQTVYRSIRSIVQDETEIEDAMQQTYLQAFAHLGQFEGQAKFSTWLVRIAINEALRRRRDMRLVDDLTQNDSSDPKENPEDQVAIRELGRWLEQAIDGLPALYRSAVMLREVEGMNTPEVAEALGVSEDVVKTRLHRARTLLRARLEAGMRTNLKEQFRFHADRCDRVVAGVMEEIP